MKRSFILIASLLITAVIAAQEVVPVQEKSQNKTNARVQQREQSQKQDGTGDQEQVRKREKLSNQEKVKQNNHGQAVSQTAKSTESGSGKGAAVRQQARTQGESLQSENGEKVSAKNQSGTQGNAAKGKSGPKGSIKATKSGGRR